MSAIETALTELSANLRRMEQRHQATGYKFDRLYDLIAAAREELAALTAPVELPTPDSYKHTLDSTEGLPGNQPEVRRTESHVSPFGTPGVDFSGEFPVTVELLYTEKQIRNLLERKQ